MQLLLIQLLSIKDMWIIIRDFISKLNVGIIYTLLKLQLIHHMIRSQIYSRIILWFSYSSLHNNPNQVHKFLLRITISSNFSPVQYSLSGKLTYEQYNSTIIRIIYLKITKNSIS